MNRHSLRTAGLVLAAAVLAACASTQSRWNGAERGHDDILQADRDRIQGMIAADVGDMELAMHDQLQYAHSNGHVDTKRSLIDTLRNKRAEYLSINVGERKIQRHDDIAVLTAPAQVEVIVGNTVHQLDGVYTAVYWYLDGRWQLLNYHSSARPKT